MGCEPSKEESSDEYSYSPISYQDDSNYYSEQPSHGNRCKLGADAEQRGRATVLRQKNENHRKVLSQNDVKKLNKIIHHRNFKRNPKWDEVLDNIEQRLEEELAYQFTGYYQ